MAGPGISRDVTLVMACEGLLSPSHWDSLARTPSLCAGFTVVIAGDLLPAPASPPRGPQLGLAGSRIRVTGEVELTHLLQNSDYTEKEGGKKSPDMRSNGQTSKTRPPARREWELQLLA